MVGRAVALRAGLAVTCAAGVGGCLATTAENLTFCPQPVTYALGDTARDSIVKGNSKLQDGRYYACYSLSLDKQTGVKVNVASPSVATFLELIDQRQVIVVNSALDTTPLTNTQMRLVLSSGGYALLVLGGNAGATGPFTLTTAQDTGAVGTCTPIWLAGGVTVGKSIVNTDCAAGPRGPHFYTHRYTVAFVFGQAITITEKSSAFAPQFVFVGPSGSTFSQADSSGAAVLSTVISSAGAYDIWVSSADSLQLGAYTLQIQ